MYTATLYFETYLGVDELHIQAECLEALKEKYERERQRRNPEASWSSDVCKDGKRI